MRSSEIMESAHYLTAARPADDRLLTCDCRVVPIGGMIRTAPLVRFFSCSRRPPPPPPPPPQPPPAPPWRRLKSSSGRRAALSRPSNIQSFRRPLTRSVDVLRRPSPHLTSPKLVSYRLITSTDWLSLPTESTVSRYRGFISFYPSVDVTWKSARTFNWL